MNGALLSPRVWPPPAQEARILQALLSRHKAIAQDLQRERNRLEKADASETLSSIRQSIRDSLVFLEQQLAKLQQDIDDHINHHPTLKTDRELLISIPAVGPQVGNHLLAVIHNHQFQSAEQLAAYLGLIPIERQSGTSILGRPRLLLAIVFYELPFSIRTQRHHANAEESCKTHQNQAMYQPGYDIPCQPHFHHV